MAKNLVAAGLADHLELQISYAIGVAEPVSLFVDTFSTEKLPDQAILQIVHKYFDLHPAAIIDTLGLRNPIYSQTAAYGHFGRSDITLPWERLDMAEALRGELLNMCSYICLCSVLEVRHIIHVHHCFDKFHSVLYKQ